MRTRGTFVALVLLSAGAARGEIRLDLSASFPSSTPGVATVELRSESGVTLSRNEVRPTSTGLSLDVPGGARTLRVTSPIHEPCEIPLAPGLREAACELLALPVIAPFRGAGGRVWARRAADSAEFEPVAPLAREWGGGFAVPSGRIDLVVAPDGTGATLYRLVEGASFVASAAPGERKSPKRLVARLVDPAGAALRAMPKVAVEPFTRLRRETELELDAWSAFFARHGVEFVKGDLVLDPIPEEPVSFTVEFQGYSGVRLATRGTVTDGVLDLGTIRIPRPTSLTVSLRSSLSDEEVPRSLSLDLELVRPAPGLRPPAKAPSLTREARIGESTRFDDLFPGEFRLFVRSADETLGFLETTVAEGGASRLEVDLTREAVTGRVEDEEGTGIADAQVGILKPRARGRGRHETRTDGLGAFRIEFLHAGGNVTVWALPAADCGQTAVEIDPRGTESSNVVLRTSPGELRIVVRDAMSSEPIGDADLDVAFVLDDDRNGSMRRKTSLPKGDTRLCNVSAGSVKIVVRAKGYETRGIDGRLDPDRSREIEVKLRRAARLRGRVFGASGAPVGGARVFAPLAPETLVDDTPRSVQNGPDGTFEIDLAAGSAPTLVAVVAAGHRLALRWLSPGPDEQAIVLMAAGPDDVVDLRYSDGVPVRGAYVVLGKDGLPIPSFVVESAVESGGCRFEPSARTGLVRFGGCIEPGTYALFGRLLTQRGFRDLPFGAQQLPLPSGAEVRSPLAAAP